MLTYLNLSRWWICCLEASPESRGGCTKTQSFALHGFVDSDLLIIYSKKKADAWALQNWVHDAQTRAEKFHNNGSQTDTVAWVLTYGKAIPPGAIEGGYDQGHTLYIVRAYQDVSRIISHVII
jgi:hypothetical protein